MTKINLKLIAKDLANKYAAKEFREGFKPTGLHVYKDEQGDLIYLRIRLKHPDGRKWIKPFHFDNNKQAWILGEPKFSGEKPLYNLDMLLKNPNADIWIFEGEQKVELFTKFGLIATTSGSSTSAASANWSHLKNRNVTIWHDNDEAGIKYAQAVTEILLSVACSVRWVAVDNLNLPPKGDVINWVATRPHRTAEDIKKIKEDIFSLPMTEPQQATNQKPEPAATNNEDQNNDSTKTTLLLDLVNEVDFFHDEQKQPFATFKNNDHLETWPVDSQKFKDWLAHQFWKIHQKSVHDGALRDALSVMKGRAVFDGQCHKVFTRVGSLNGKIYINLANERWQVVEISCSGWNILNEAPIKFRGTQNMKALPIPLRENNKFSLLWNHINIPKKSQILVHGWLLESLFPDTPFPLLLFTGLQGSGKSRTQEILRNLIDPSTPNLRSAPKNADDIPIAAANNWVVSYNNVSKLSTESQDDLCCLSTGGGFARRRLYTTDEEAVVDIKRPVMINGIGDLVTRQDLIDRCVSIDLPAISETSRKSDSELDEEFYHAYPSILGGLYNSLADTLKTLPTINLPSKPRMASFAVLGSALEKVLNLETGTFLKEYKGNYQENMASAIESSPVAIALIKFMQHRANYLSTFGELLNLLSCSLYRPEMAGWPKSAKGLANALKRQAPALAVIGFKLNFDDKRHKDGYHIEIINNQEATD